MAYDHILRDTDLVMVNRGGVNYKVTGAQIHSIGDDIFQDTDLFMVQSTLEPVGNPQPALYSVSFGTLKNSPSSLLSSPSDFFLVERDNQLFSVENPFRKRTDPGLVCIIDSSGLNNNDRAFAFLCEGAINLSDRATPALYYLNDANEIIDSVTFSTGSDGNELLVSDAVDLGITKAVIKGVYSSIRFTNSLGLLSVKFQGDAASWNNFIKTPGPENGRFMFALCAKLTHVFGMTGYGPAMPAGMLKSLGSAFRGCKLFNGDISSWDTSEVTNMEDAFGHTDAFNKDISSWDTSKVEDMSFMFDSAAAFDKPLNSWNVESVTDFQCMFRDAATFNQPLNNWTLTAANGPDRNNIALNKMFETAVQFNQDLSGWCVTKYPTEPLGFADGSGLNAANYPVWGTCP